MHQEIHDQADRRFPLGLIGSARGLMEEAGSREEMDAAASISDRILSDVYRFYAPESEYTQKTDAEQGGEHAQETDISTMQSLLEIQRAEDRLHEDVTDSAGRRVPLQILERSRDFLMEASSQAELDMAMSFNDKALDEIYQCMLPKHERHSQND